MRRERATREWTSLAAVGLVGVLEQITVEKSRRRMINGRISPVEDDEGDVFNLI